MNIYEISFRDRHGERGKTRTRADSRQEAIRQTEEAFRLIFNTGIYKPLL